MGKHKSNWAVGAIFAGAIGYITGILTAPKSGKDTRDDIQKAAAKTKKETEKKLKELHSELDELLDKAKSQAGNLKTTSKKELDDLVDKAKAAKQKAKETISGIHEGDSGDNKELQKAVDDVTNAIKHLKQYAENKTNKKGE